MTIIRVGTTQKYSEGWAAAFGGKKKTAGNGAASKPTASKAAKASAKKAKPATKKKAKR